MHILFGFVRFRRIFAPFFVKKDVFAFFKGCLIWRFFSIFQLFISLLSEDFVHGLIRRKAVVLCFINHKSFNFHMQQILIIFSAFLLLRLVSLSISIKNEKRLKRVGAVQYGKLNSLLLTLAHVAYYFSSLYEAYISGVSFNRYSVIGTVVIAFSYIMLFYVIYKLRDVWTVKLYIAPAHRIETSFLFRVVRHPNYFLNIIPELIGIGLLCNSWYTMMIGLPLYCCLLAVRIVQEEQVMKILFSEVRSVW